MRERLPYELHVLPSLERIDLPTLDPDSLAATFILQRTIPGEYSLCRTVNSESSPSGSLPYLQHHHHTVSSIQSILNYVENSTKPNRVAHSVTNGVDAHLTVVERAKCKAWSTHIQTHLGDLVSYILYASDSNWEQITHPTLSASLAFLQRGLASRLRSDALVHLEDVGLRTSTVEPEEERKSFAERQKKERERLPLGHFKETFGRQKVTETAAAYLGLYSNMLGSNPYFFGDRLTTLDILLASHILILTVPEYPDTLIRNAILDEFPALVKHAQRVQSTIFPSGYSNIPQVQPSPPSFSAAFPKLTWSSIRGGGPVRGDIERQFHRARWFWYAGALLGSIAYIAIFTPIRIVLVQGGEVEDHEEEEDIPQSAENLEEAEEVTDSGEEGWTTHG